MAAVGKGVYIVGKAIKLFSQLRLFVYKVGHIVAQRAVQHKYDHILTGLTQTEVGRFLCVHMGHIGLHLVGALDDLNAVPYGHSRGAHNRNGQDGCHNSLFLGCQPPNAHEQHPDQRKIDELFHTGIEEALIVLQIGGDQTQIEAKEHKVGHCHDGGHRCQPGKDHLALVVCQPVEHRHPHQEGAAAHCAGDQQIVQRIMEGVDVHKFLGRCADHGGGDHQAGQDRQHSAGKQKYLLIRLGRFHFAPLCPEKGDQLANEQGNAQGADRQHDLQNLLGVLQLIEDGLNQAEQVI